MVERRRFRIGLTSENEPQVRFAGIGRREATCRVLINPLPAATTTQPMAQHPGCFTTAGNQRGRTLGPTRAGRRRIRRVALRPESCG